MAFEYTSRVPPEGGAEMEMLAVRCASFRLSPVTDPNIEDGIFSVWAQASAPAQIEVVGGDANVIAQIGIAWSRIVAEIGGVDDIEISVPNSATVYFYKAQFESGTRTTDWAPAPEDMQDALDAVQSTADDAAQVLKSIRVALDVEPEALYIRPVQQLNDGSWVLDSSGMHTRNSSDSFRIINPKADTATKAHDGSLILLERSVIIDDDVTENIPGWCVVHRMREAGDGAIG